jgi:hypothetical protein
VVPAAAWYPAGRRTEPADMTDMAHATGATRTACFSLKVIYFAGFCMQKYGSLDDDAHSTLCSRKKLVALATLCMQ